MTAWKKEYGRKREAKIRADPEKVTEIREKKRLYRAAHKAEANEKQRLWRAANPDKVREAKKRSYVKNRDKARETQRAYHEKNREKLSAKNKARRAANPEEHRRHAALYRQRHPTKVKEWTVKFRETNRASVIWSYARRSSKQKGIDFDLDIEWVRERLAIGRCEMSGIPFDMSGKRTPNSPSVDRIRPYGPYTKANCRLIIWWLNKALSNMGEDYSLDVFRRILRRRGEMMPAPCLRLIA